MELRNREPSSTSSLHASPVRSASFFKSSNISNHEQQEDEAIVEPAEQVLDTLAQTEKQASETRKVASPKTKKRTCERSAASVKSKKRKAESSPGNTSDHNQSQVSLEENKPKRLKFH